MYPFCVVGLEGHGMAGTCIVMSGHRCGMFSCLGDRGDVFGAIDGGAGAGHVKVN